jgi:hypothetical protein
MKGIEEHAPDARDAELRRVRPGAALMKRKTVIALGCLAMVFAVMVLLDWRYSQTGVNALSTKDFREIQQTIRRSMWRTAFPDFSLQTIMASPGSLYRLAFSHIQQMDLSERGNYVRVGVQTPAGLYLYDVRMCFSKIGEPSWQIDYQRRAGNFMYFSSAGHTVIPVKHGYGLIAGSPRPGYVFQVTQKQERVLEQEQFVAGLSNHTRLTLKR